MHMFKKKGATQPVFLSDSGKPMKSSGGGVKSSMLQRVRAILLQMQLAGDPELVDVKVGEVSRYCWKISGTTGMLAQKKDGTGPDPLFPVSLGPASEWW